MQVYGGVKENSHISMGCGVRIYKGSGSVWALGRLGEDRRWHCSHGHPCCCLHPLVTLPFLPQLPCPHCVPISVGSTSLTYPTVGAQGAPPLYSRGADRKKHILAVFAQRVSVCGRKSCLISQAGWLPALQGDGQGYGLALGLAGSKPTVSHKNRTPAVPVPLWLGSSGAQLCTDVFSWQAQPAQAWPL